MMLAAVVLWVVVALVRAYRWVAHAMCRTRARLALALSPTLASAPAIAQKAKLLSKLPQHVCLAFTHVDPQLPMADVGKFVAWSIAAGVKYITIWDTQGYFERKRVEVEGAIAAAVGGVFKGDAPVVVCEPATHEHTPVTHERASHRVQTLSAANGRSAIVNAIQDMSRVATAESFASSITLDSFNTAISQYGGTFPDPELLITCGEHYSLFGALPWQTRLTEILHYQTIQDLTPSEFMRAFNFFARTQQRLGK
eukprot:m.455778 g.455778  ORF g.455778 m.455778 type:complete len:254 (+) comp56967_c0_seq2:69-830(+)